MPRTISYNFTDSNAKAVNLGTKTRTRRGMAVQPIPGEQLGIVLPIELAELSKKMKTASAKGYKNLYTGGPLKGMLGPKPPVEKGDTILVRERHRIASWSCTGDWRIEFPDGKSIRIENGLYANDLDGRKEEEQLLRLADWCERHKVPKTDDENFDLSNISMPWRQPMFLPHKAVRTRLEVLSCEPTRLQTITEEQAIAEGIEVLMRSNRLTFPDGITAYRDYTNANNYFQRPDYSFRSLWISIHGLDSWTQNDWVWDVEFRKIIG